MVTPMNNGYLYLLFSVIFGSFGNIMAKESKGFTKPLMSFLCLFGICSSILIHSKALETLPIGITFITYSVLVGLFTVLFGIHYYNEPFDRYILFGTIFILIGIVMLHRK